jgi:hypothetical protein
VRFLRQLLFAFTFPVTFTALVVGSIVVGVADTVNLLATCFVDLTAPAGVTTKPIASAQTAAAPISRFI